MKPLAKSNNTPNRKHKSNTITITHNTMGNIKQQKQGHSQLNTTQALTTKHVKTNSSRKQKEHKLRENQ